MTAVPPSPSTEWAYFLDVDGTLIDIARTPSEVAVDSELLTLIEELHERCSGALALVSGRMLDDLDRILGRLPLPMAGLHGLEWRHNGSDGIQRHRIPENDLHAVKQRLTWLRQRYAQLIVEDKGETLALHYRQAPRLGSYLHRWVRNLIAQSGKELQVQPGKRVIEIKPRGFDKGSAIETFMAHPPFAGRLPVFIGDDQTDEHGFAMVNRMGGLSIKVGRGHTAATCRLPSVAAVRDWLADMTRSTEAQATGAKSAIT